jgi:hypothetical protein
METAIFWLSVAFAAYWGGMWVKYCNLSVGHSAQIICAGMLWAVVTYFYMSPEISRFHMLWAMPVAFFGSSLASFPYIKWRMWLLRRKHGLE